MVQSLKRIASFLRWGGLCISSLFVLCLLGLYIKDPILLTILWYRQPTSQTYHRFPQERINASNRPFHFTEAGRHRKDLDTITVFDGRRRVLSLAEYLKAGKTTAFIVIRNDTILYQMYDKGYTDTTTVSVFSIAKSILSLLVGRALRDGAIQSLDDPISKYLPELNRKPAFEGVTIRHLLSMNSGLAFRRKGGGIISDLFSDEATYFYADNIKDRLLQSERVTLPGTQWQYKNVDPLLLGWLLEKATGQRLAHYTQTTIWQPIGAAYPASWSLDHPGGLANTASSFQTTPLDLAKVGRLFLLPDPQGGSATVPAIWLHQLKRVEPANNSLPKGWQQTKHQYYWWLPQAPPRGDLAAEGMLGQRLYIDPATHTIIVHLARAGAGDYPYRKVAQYLAGKSFTYPK